MQAMANLLLKKFSSSPLTWTTLQRWNASGRVHTLCSQCQNNHISVKFPNPSLIQARTLNLSLSNNIRFFNFTASQVSQGPLHTMHDTYLNCGPWRPLITRKIASDPRQKQKNRTGLIYISAIGIFMVGMAYAGVPLYRMFCQAAGLGGQAVTDQDVSKITSMSPVKERLIRIRFNADTASSMQWNFRPQQSEVVVLPGETALAFYTAKNPTDKPIIGISTYNVVPYEAGQYFNKIQCFCFEEQRLNPHEQVDMPVFFYIDPEYVDDPKLQKTDLITLSYTFFEAKEGMVLPFPGYSTAKY